MKSLIKAFFHSSILRKQLIAITGILLCGFLVSHLIGNCLMFMGAEVFNIYAHRLTSNPLIYVAETLLALVFLVHFGTAMKLTVENYMARGQRYHWKKTTGQGATMASSTMPYTGFIIIIFVILHIKALKFGPVYYQTYNGEQIRDLFRTCVEYFSNPLAVVGYILAMIAVGMHTYHGVWSAFQSFGISHPRYLGCFKWISRTYAFSMGLGFSILPIYCFMQRGTL